MNPAVHPTANWMWVFAHTKWLRQNHFFKTMPRLSGGGIVLEKECLGTRILTNLGSESGEKLALCVHWKSIASFISTREKVGGKTKVLRFYFGWVYKCVISRGGCLVIKNTTLQLHTNKSITVLIVFCSLFAVAVCWDCLRKFSVQLAHF